MAEGNAPAVEPYADEWLQVLMFHYVDSSIAIPLLFPNLQIVDAILDGGHAWRPLCAQRLRG